MNQEREIKNISDQNNSVSIRPIIHHIRPIIHHNGMYPIVDLAGIFPSIRADEEKKSNDDLTTTDEQVE